MTTQMILQNRVGLGKSAMVVLGVVVVLGAASVSVYLLSTSGSPGPSTTSQTSGHVLLSLGQTPRLLGPGITMNYTLTISPGTGALGSAELSSTGGEGVEVTISPANVNLAGNDIAVDVSIHAGPNVTRGDHPIGFNVAWPGGSANITYQFQVVQHLILLLGGTTGPGPFSPSISFAHPGETVTWLSIDRGSDEYGGQRSVEVVGLNASSPTLTLYATWSFSFSQTGTYKIEDPLNSVLVADGTVVVS